MFSSGGGGAVGHDTVEGVTLSLADRATGPVLLVSPPFPAKPKEIRLKWIKKVRTHSSGMMGTSSRSGIEIINTYGNELLRFDVLKEASMSDNQEDDGWTDAVAAKIEDADEERRDDIIHKLEVLAEWERRRQNYLVTLGEEETDDEQTVDEFDDEDESSSSPRVGKVKNALKGKIDQVKHFAERELELKKMKREREERKAKYVKEAGGLKYTAIAMANRS